MGRCPSAAGVAWASDVGGASQQGMTSGPRSTGPLRLRPHSARPPAMPRRKWRQAMQAVVILPHSQQRDVSGWGVLQWGQRQGGMLQA